MNEGDSHRFDNTQCMQEGSMPTWLRGSSFPTTMLGGAEGKMNTHTHTHTQRLEPCVLIARGFMVGCGSHLIGRSSSTPSTCPHIPSSCSPYSPLSPHLATLHCPAKRWQLVTNGLRCTLCVSCSGRRWPTRGREGEKRRKRAGSPLQQQGAWHRWPKINTDPASDWAWQHKSSGVWESTECHTQLNWMMEGKRAEEEQRERGEDTLFHMITLTFWRGDKDTLQTHAQLM